MSRMKIRLRHDTRSARNQVELPHRGVPCFAAADCSTQRSTSDNFRCSHVAKGLTYPTEVRACRDLTRGGGYAPPHRHAEVCRRFAKPSTNYLVCRRFCLRQPLSSKFVEKKFVEGSLTIIVSSLSGLLSRSRGHAIWPKSQLEAGRPCCHQRRSVFNERATRM